VADLAVSVLAAVIPKSYSCDNPSCHRQSATFGDVILHSRVNEPTHAMMGDLIPECLTGFLKDVAVWGRKTTVLEGDDRRHLDRLKLPIRFISGSENKMFVPKSTERTFNMLCEVNGPSDYRRDVYDDFGHLDCFVGDGANKTIWPDLTKTLG
jgi:cholesterol oxidase